MAINPAWDPLERFLFGIAITLIFITGVLYFIKGLRNEDKNSKILLCGFACILFGISIDISSSYLRDFLIPGEFIGYTYYGDYDFLDPTIKTIIRIGCASFTIGYALFFLAFEHTIKRTKYFVTVSQILLIGLIIALPYESMPFIYNYILYFLNIILLVMILNYFVKLSLNEYRGISLELLLGFSLYATGTIFSGRVTKQIVGFPLFIAPLFYILGSIMLFFPVFLGPKAFSSSIKLWFLSAVFLIIFVNLVFIYLLIAGFPLFFGLFSLIVDIFVVYFLIYNIKQSKKPVNPPNGNNINILGMFNKPKNLSEEEISISKEKKVCLVCKGEVRGFNSFICKCDTIYCQKCAKTLSNIENACWACGRPLDESKPIKNEIVKEAELEPIVENHKNIKKS